MQLRAGSGNFLSCLPSGALAEAVAGVEASGGGGRL